eukprot:TRINITY_DN9251_c0_g1_i4.p1 TRINITY_DN9251_c0_g1~~TRINITY_DN9251_c0_g1_i4.p1  ORF type:complete len:344 (+),score=49.07 TRINITY_DN9251_c0_g1_i4:374-1405(+)
MMTVMGKVVISDVLPSSFPVHFHVLYRSFQLVCLAISIFLIYHTNHSLETKQGLPFVNQQLSWVILLSSLVCLAIPIPCHYVDLLVHTFLCLASPLVMLSVSFEVLFFCTFGGFLIIWVIIESSLWPLHQHTIPAQDLSRATISPSHSVSIHDVRRAVTYIFFCYVAFFGTGNIASISSFQLSSTYRFVTIFSPFVMTGLLVLKLVSPIIIVACVYAAINRMLNIPYAGCFFLVIGLSDMMTIAFFFLVRDYGSWQDIGASISHFGISNLIIILHLILFGGSSLHMRSARFGSKLASESSSYISTSSSRAVVTREVGMFFHYGPLLLPVMFPEGRTQITYRKP